MNFHMPRRASIAVALVATLAMGSMPNDHGDPPPENGTNDMASDTAKQDMLIELLRRAVNGTVDVKVTVNGVPPADLLRKGLNNEPVANTSSGEASDSSAASSSGGASSPSSAVVDQDPSESTELVTGPPESEAASSGGASSSGDASSPGGAGSSVGASSSNATNSPGGAIASTPASLVELESTTAAPLISASSPAELESKAKELAEKEQALNKKAADLEAKEARLNASAAGLNASEPPASPPVEGYKGFFDGIIKSPMDITWGDKLQGEGLKDPTIVPTLQKMMGDAEGSIDVEITFELPAGAFVNGTAGLFAV